MHQGTQKKQKKQGQGGGKERRCNSATGVSANEREEETRVEEIENAEAQSGLEYFYDAREKLMVLLVLSNKSYFEFPS